MKIYINNKTIIRKTKLEKYSICSFCYFNKYNIDCFEYIYHNLRGCFKNSSYYVESNADNSLFKL